MLANLHSLQFSDVFSNERKARTWKPRILKMKALLGFSSGLLLLEHERHPLRFLNISHSPAQQVVREFGVRVLENSRNFTRSRRLCCLGKKQEATQRRLCNNSRSSDGALHMNDVGTQNGGNDDGDVRYYIRRIREALGAEACSNGHDCFSVSGEENTLQPHVPHGVSSNICLNTFGMSET